MFRQDGSINLATLAQQIAVSLPDWCWLPPDEDKEWHSTYQYLRGPDGVKLCLSYDSRKQRLRVGGDYPRQDGKLFPYSGKDQPDSITLNPQREPAGIAKDILRRFIPAYLEAFRKGVEQKAEHVAHEQGKKALAVKLCGLLENEKPHGQEAIEFSKYNKSPWYIRGRCGGPDSVQLKIDSLSAARAEAVFKLLLSFQSVS
jgi:hypothetical protein